MRIQSPVSEIRPPVHSSEKFRCRRMRSMRAGLSRLAACGPYNPPAMTELPAGYTARPVRPDDDVRALMRLQNAVAMADYGVGEVDERLAREPYNLPSFNAERDSWFVHDADGEPAGLVEFYD